MMNHFLALILIAILGATPLAAAEGEVLHLVPVNAPIVVVVNDFQQLKAKVRKHPLMQLWEEPTMRAFTAPVRENMRWEKANAEVKEAVGYEIEELMGFMQGQCVFAIPDLLTFRAALGEEGVDPDAVSLMVAGYAGDKADELLQLLLRERQKPAPEGRNIAHGEELFQGVQMYTVTIHDDEGAVEQQAAWAVHDKIFVLATPIASAKLAVSGLVGRGGESVAANPQYLNVRRSLEGQADMMAFVNLRQLLPPFLRQLEASLQPGPQGQPPLAGITYPNLEQALAFNSLDSVYLGARVADTETLVQGGLHYSEHKGLAKLINYGKHPVTPPTWMPRDVIEAGAVEIDIHEWWQTLIATIREISPQVGGLVTMQFGQLQAATGVDLERQLLANLGTTVAWTSDLRPDPQPGVETAPRPMNQVYGVKLKDPQGVELAINGLQVLAAGGPQATGPPPFDQREYLGEVIHTFRSGPDFDPQRAFRYAFVRDWLLISPMCGPDLLEGCIRQMKDPGEHFFGRADVRQAMAAAPCGARMIQVQDLAKAARAGIDSICARALAEPADPPGRLRRMIDPQARPDPEVLRKHLGFGVGATYTDDFGMTYRYLMRHKE